MIKGGANSSNMNLVELDIFFFVYIVFGFELYLLRIVVKSKIYRGYLRLYMYMYEKYILLYLILFYVTIFNPFFFSPF